MAEGGRFRKQEIVLIFISSVNILNHQTITLRRNVILVLGNTLLYGL